MDSRKRDELIERRREEALARRMGEALDRLSPHEAVECPDAEIIAAYHERALQPEETAEWESHFAGCSRCRKILTVLAASLDAPLAEKEVAQLGELVAGAVRSPQAAPSQKSKPRGPNRWDWRARWLAPALGAAAVLAIWFAVRAPWRPTSQESSETLIAQAPKSETQPSAEVPALDRLSKVVPQQDQKAEAVTPRDRSTTNTPLLIAPAEAPAERRADANNAIGKVSPSAEVATSTLQKEKKLGGTSDEGTTHAPEGPAPAAPPPPLSPKVQGAMEAQAVPQARAAAEPGTAVSEAPATKTMAGAASNAPSRDKPAPAPQRAAGAMVTPEASPQVSVDARNDQNLRGFKASAQIPALMKAPSGSTFWRAGKDGSIERSTDAGRTWTAQARPSREDWLAGAVISDRIGWLVGRNGAIAKTTDGEHWERVMPPPQVADSAAKSPDWTGITARDAQIATITARDGRRFATQDGGKTWQAQ